MAQSGYTPILVYASGTTGNTPSAGNLTSSSSGAELALNYFDGKLFYKDNAGVVQVLANKGTGTIGGSNTQVQYNSSGALAGSANLTFNGTTLTANTLNLTNALGVAYGGTGQNSNLTQYGVVYGSTTTAMASTAAGTSTQVLHGNASGAPTWGAVSLSADVSGTLPVANGGTGQSSALTQYGVVYGSATTAMASTAAGTSTQVLHGNASGAPTWGAVSLSADVTGTLPTANGGTGLASFTANRVFYASSSSVVAQSANLTFDGSSLTVSGSAATPPVAVTFSATAMTVNCVLSNVFTTTFTANVTVAPTISNPQDGQTINWFITQDATGGRTMTWPTSFKWPGGSAGVLSTGANAVDLVTATYRSATGFWYVSLLKAFS